MSAPRPWSAGSGSRARNSNTILTSSTTRQRRTFPSTARSRRSRADRAVMAVLLALERVAKSYGALKVTDDLTLAVEEGEALAVIGPNGAGKSTMFNLITGDVAPDAGRILFRGGDITSMAPHKRSRLGIGRTYQIPHPFANMTVFENLLVGATFGAGERERASYERCAKVLETTGLLSRANMPARTLTLLQ